MSTANDPLVEPVSAEVPLQDTPLVRVIAQLRFPEILSVGQRERVAPFQEAIRARYPVLRMEQTQSFVLGSGSSVNVKPQVAWRFSDTTGHWRVSLTPEFLAIETTHYRSRADFFGRLRDVALALGEHIGPAQVDRLGVRYIDRLTGSDLDNIANLLRPEVRGILGTPAAAHAVHTLTETMFTVDEDQVLARWGLLPAGETVDLAAIEPATAPSFLLDLDMFSAGPLPFDVDAIVERAQRYAERVYTVFRWAVTDDLLRRFGGLP
jgi:uncharacterized protein (TIGR04255 family)